MTEDNNINNNTIIIPYEEDRLSSLPDALLIEILSLLPFASAAATSTLSRCWVSLWTHHPHIIIDDHFPYSHDFNKFFTVVDKIINQTSSLDRIKTFILDFHHPNLDFEQFYVCSRALNSWVPLICARNPLHFKVSLTPFSGRFFPLPTCVFQTKSLQQIDLMGYFYCKLPDSGNITLPNLKKLSLCCLHFDPKGLNTLFKSCPLLESLLLRLEFEEDEAVEISNPILKSLTIWTRDSSLKTKFVIDTPLLEEFELQECIASYIFVNHPCNLVSARINIRNLRVNHHTQLTQMLDLVQVISNIKFLELDNSAAFFTTLDRTDPNVWSLFRNLTCLRLCVQYEYMNDWGASVPLCLLSRIDEIELSGFKGNSDDMRSVGFILQYASVLKQLCIRCYSDSKRKMWREYKLCCDLFRLSRRSPTCLIVFKGEYIHARSNGWSQVQGASQFNWISPHLMWSYIGRTRN